jgi:hypothetical protein
VAMWCCLASTPKSILLRIRYISFHKILFYLPLQIYICFANLCFSRLLVLSIALLSKSRMKDPKNSTETDRPKGSSYIIQRYITSDMYLFISTVIADHLWKLQKGLNVRFMLVIPFQIRANSLTFDPRPSHPPVLISADLGVEISQQKERPRVLLLKQLFVAWAHSTHKGEEIRHGGVFAVSIP